MATQDSDSMSASPELVSQPPDTSAADTLLLGKFQQMLQSELAVTAKRITDDLTKQIQDLGARTDMVENKIDDMQQLHDALLMLEDGDNRSRHNNVRVRGLPETITDLRRDITGYHGTVFGPAPEYRLEFDRIHLALRPYKQGDPPRDIIIRFHYHQTQVEVLRAARERGSLDFRDHSYQLYPDLSPTTLQKRRTMQPVTKILQHHKVRYRWAFPFRLAFAFNNRSYSMDTPEEGLATLAKLQLVDQHPSTPQASPPKKLTPLWQKVGPARPQPVVTRASQKETGRRRHFLRLSYSIVHGDFPSPAMFDSAGFGLLRSTFVCSPYNHPSGTFFRHGAHD
ncbi:hypothetical protein XELAEV_18042027mg [Xenopus laevis]|uniref:Uncharacterized protein n=1 Tax=Xenopus laevis TaxID=8355 RepID=A0A974C3Y4_XENLA|nr:hypothetical protein XELAEV_18042027mg [Xenopus laevis]